MKKQGPPEPLSEEHFANLKRKKGIPVDTPTDDAPSKKRRKASKPEPANGHGAVAKDNTQHKREREQANGAKGISKPQKNSSKASKPTPRKPEPEPSSDDELDDEFGDSGFGDEEKLSDLEYGLDGQLGDDFLGSDSSVVDSDAERGPKEEFVFSDDEDDSDLEEKLTAANIEGLSRNSNYRLPKRRLSLRKRASRRTSMETSPMSWMTRRKRMASRQGRRSY
jgi:25S rRNA (cytosine2870-C5)-methyltransferase